MHGYQLSGRQQTAGHHATRQRQKEAVMDQNTHLALACAGMGGAIHEWVVLIENDVELAPYLKVKLSLAGFQVVHSDTVMGGLVLVRESNPAVVVANVDLVHGQDIVTRLDRTGVPLILLTSLQGGAVLPSGNVEVIRKPFPFHALLEQMRLLSVSRSCLSVGAMCLDIQARQLTVGELPVSVSAKEFELLRTLVRHPHRVFSPEELRGMLWPDREVRYNSLTVLVAGVRRKLESVGQPDFIRTVRGYGYGLRT